MSLEAAARSSYGFANQHNGVFSKLQVSCESINCFEFVNKDMASLFFLQEEIPSIVDCPDPDHMTSYERRMARLANEEASFDPEHYLYVDGVP